MPGKTKRFQIIYRSYVNRQHFRLRSFASLFLNNNYVQQQLQQKGEDDSEPYKDTVTAISIFSVSNRYFDHKIRWLLNRTALSLKI